VGAAWCEVRKYCFECEEYSYSKFKEYADHDAMDGYKRFKEMRFERWIEREAQKAEEGCEIHLQKAIFLKP
jgi:hypothetical protein